MEGVAFMKIEISTNPSNVSCQQVVIHTAIHDVHCQHLVMRMWCKRKLRHSVHVSESSPLLYIIKFLIYFYYNLIYMKIMGSKQSTVSAIAKSTHQNPFRRTLTEDERIKLLAAHPIFESFGVVYRIDETNTHYIVHTIQNRQSYYAYLFPKWIVKCVIFADTIAKTLFRWC